MWQTLLEGWSFYFIPIKRQFKNKKDFPNLLGAIDWTRISIKAPEELRWTFFRE